MEQFGIFDIIGPVMIGPSSSHTAGAAKIGYMARGIFGKEIKKIKFTLHGSFAKTYLGHGTDKALLSGIMGFLPDDDRLKSAYEIADEKGMKYEFTQGDLGEVHPNTVKIKMTGQNDDKMVIVGSSIGGGKVKIIKINDFDVEFDGEYTTLITKHIDKPGVVSGISSVLADNKLNIAYMKLYRHAKGKYARLVLETDEIIPGYVLKEIKEVKNIKEVKCVEKLIL